MLLPKPPRHHYSNKELVCRTDFWKKVLTVANDVIHAQLKSNDSFSVYTIALNFGTWETAVEKDPYALSCHGHAHFLLTREAVENCKQFEDDDAQTSFRNLANRLHEPTNYRLQDAKLLEQDVLIGEENKMNRADNKKILGEMKDLTAMVKLLVVNSNVSTYGK